MIIVIPGQGANFQTMPSTPGSGPLTNPNTPAHQRSQNMSQTMYNVSHRHFQTPRSINKNSNFSPAEASPTRAAPTCSCMTRPTVTMSPRRTSSKTLATLTTVRRTSTTGVWWAVLATVRWQTTALTWAATLLNSSCCLVRSSPSRRHNNNNRRWCNNSNNRALTVSVWLWQLIQLLWILLILPCIPPGGFPQPHAEYSTDTVIYKGGPPSQPSRGALPSVSKIKWQIITHFWFPFSRLRKSFLLRPQSEETGVSRVLTPASMTGLVALTIMTWHMFTILL